MRNHVCCNYASHCYCVQSIVVVLVVMHLQLLLRHVSMFSMCVQQQRCSQASICA